MRNHVERAAWYVLLLTLVVRIHQVYRERETRTAWPEEPLVDFAQLRTPELAILTLALAGAFGAAYFKDVYLEYAYQRELRWAEDVQVTLFKKKHAWLPGKEFVTRAPACPPCATEPYMDHRCVHERGLPRGEFRCGCWWEHF